MSSLKNLSTAFRGIKKNSEAKPGDLVKLPIDDVVSHAQVRKHFAKIDELAASIEKEGLLIPINVTPKNADGKYVIIQGERRWRACQKAGLTHIEAVIREAPETEQNRILTQITENIQRDDMDPVDLAVALKALRDSGMKVKDISHRLGKSDYYVSAFLPLATLPKEVTELRKRVKINDPWILNPLRQMFEADALKANALVEGALSRGNELTRTLVAGLKDQMIAKPEKTPRTTKVAKPAAKAKKPEVVAPEEPMVQHSYRCVPRGASATSVKLRVDVLVRIPGQEKPVEGFIAPDLLADEPDHVCVIVGKVAYVLPIEDVVINGVAPY